MVTAAALGACGGLPHAQPLEPASMQTNSVLIAGGGAIVPDGASSRMSAAAKSARKLLYISDSHTFDVYVYSFPSLARAGKLTGFDRPQGECADTKGNVWIASTQSEKVYEFAHGAKTPIVTLTDPLGYPAACAVEPTSGDLAVVNLYDFSGYASVLIYKHGRGTPTPYANPNQSSNYFAGYDSKDDLYVSGQTAKHVYSLSVLPHGGNSMSSVGITGGTIYFPGTVAWQGSKLVLGDQKCKKRAASCLYELTVSGRTAHISGKTPLNAACDVAQAWVGSTQVAGGDYEYCGHGHSSVDIWPYPSGGKPTTRVTGPRMPVGAVLSVSGGP